MKKTTVMCDLCKAAIVSAWTLTIKSNGSRGGGTYDICDDCRELFDRLLHPSAYNDYETHIVTHIGEKDNL